MGPKATARAARWASGVDGAWSLDGKRDDFDGPIRMIEQCWKDAGRDDTPHRSTSIWYALGDGAEERLRAYAYRYMKIFGEDVATWAASSVACFTPVALRHAINNAAAAGADEFFLVPTTTDPTELDRTREALGL
jgi:hypothetical protein